MPTPVIVSDRRGRSDLSQLGYQSVGDCHLASGSRRFTCVMSSGARMGVVETSPEGWHLLMREDGC